MLSLAFHLISASNKCFIMLAAPRRSVLRVCGAHLCIIIPAGNTAPFEEKSQQWRAVGNTVSDLTGSKFEPHLLS